MRKNDRRNRAQRRAFLRSQKAKWKMQIHKFAEEEDAISVLEIVLIMVVLIALVLIFKEQLTKLVKNILNKVTTQSNSV